MREVYVRLAWFFLEMIVFGLCPHLDTARGIVSNFAACVCMFHCSKWLEVKE